MINCKLSPSIVIVFGQVAVLALLVIPAAAVFLGNKTRVFWRNCHAHIVNAFIRICYRRIVYCAFNKNCLVCNKLRVGFAKVGPVVFKIFVISFAAFIQNKIIWQRFYGNFFAAFFKAFNLIFYHLAFCLISYYIRPAVNIEKFLSVVITFFHLRK